MNGIASKVLTISAVLFFAGLMILAIPSFLDPEFEVINNSPEVVTIIAIWRSQEKEIASINSMSTLHFSVNDEAAIKFKVHYSSGSMVESKELYFTSGTKIIATITDNGIEVRYDFET